MLRLLSLSLLTLTLFCGCATKSQIAYQSGDYRLISLSANAQRTNITVLLKLSETNLALAGTKNSWIAEVSDNIIGPLTPVRRNESQQVGSIEGIFLQTIEGAEIQTNDQGLLTFNKKGLVVAVFEPMQ